MSFTQNRRGDFQGIKTKEFVLQDPSGSFPPINSILVVGDEKGGITTTQNLTIPEASIELQELTTKADSTGRYITLRNGGLEFLNKSGNITNPGEFSINKDSVNGNFNIVTKTTGKTNISIDASGSMVMAGFSTKFNSSEPTASDITINGNIYVGGSDSQTTGTVNARTLVLNDRVVTGESRLWSSNNDLYWQSPNGIGTMLTQWVSLLEPSPESLAPLASSASTSEIITALNTIINLFNTRNIFFTTPYILRPVIFNTYAAISIGIFPIIEYFTPFISPQYYTDISGLTNELAGKGFPVSFDTKLNKVFIDVRSSPVTISDYTDINNRKYGSAQRLLNHLGFSNLDGTRILTVPPSGTLTIQQSIYGRVIDGSGTSDPGLGYRLVLPNPTVITQSEVGSRNATITWTNLIPTDSSYDKLQFFGIYLNSQSHDITNSKNYNDILSYTYYGLTRNTTYTYSVTSIGTYDESGQDIVFSFTTNSDAAVPISTGILLTQYSPNTTITNVIPFDTTTYGTSTGFIVDSSGIADPLSTVLPYDSMVTQTYLYASSFTITFPDNYKNVYIGFYSPDGGTVDAYRLTISGITIGIWEQQPVFGTGVAQYFKVPDFIAGVQYQASIVAMNSYTSSYPYSVGIFIVQVQTDFDPTLVDIYRYFSPTLDQYPRTPLMAFCSPPVVL